MKIIIAPDSFKGCLSSSEVAKAIADAASTHECITIPIADGGEGSLDAIKGEYIYCQSVDSLLRPINSKYKVINHNAAFLELAQTAALSMLKKEEQNPELTSSFGLGIQILHAIDRGHRTFFIALGGSSTNDAGIGMLSALGYKFLDKNGNTLPHIGKSLQHITHIDASLANPILNKCRFSIICDVTNPFSGPNGAAHIFAPQKGANSKMVQSLNKGLVNVANLISKEKYINLNSIKGSGAAGGIAGAFAAFFNSKLIRGIEFFIEANNVEQLCSDADLIITGEGAIDKQTTMGKAPLGILNIGKKHNIPVVAIAGLVKDTNILISMGFHDILQVTPKNMPINNAINSNIATKNIQMCVHNFLNTCKIQKNNKLYFDIR